MSNYQHQIMHCKMVVMIKKTESKVVADNFADLESKFGLNSVVKMEMVLIAKIIK